MSRRFIKIIIVSLSVVILSQQACSQLKPSQLAMLNSLTSNGTNSANNQSSSDGNTPTPTNPAPSPSSACTPPQLASGSTLTLGQCQLGNIFSVNETPMLPFASQGDQVEYQIKDYAGQTVDGGTVNLNGSSQALVRPVLPDGPGYYEITLQAYQSGTLLNTVTTSLAMIPDFSQSELSVSPFGVHTQFAQGWSTDVLPLMRKAGIRHGRDEQAWQQVEKTSGIYDFSKFQPYVSAYGFAGLDFLQILDFGNKLYDHDSSGWVSPYTTQGVNGFANYTQALLKSLGPGLGTAVKEVEVWNEWNGSWGIGPVTKDLGGYYTNLLKSTYQAVKAIAPNIKVIGGASVPIPLPFLEDQFQNGALKSMDAVVVHPYLEAVVAEQQLENVRALMRNYNNGQTLPIWATEFGSWADPSFGRRQSSQYLMQMAAVLAAHGVERMHWFLLRDTTTFPHMGLLHSGTDPGGPYTPTSTYVVYANLIANLANAKPLGRVTTVDSRDRVYAYQDGSDQVWIAWSNFGPSVLSFTTSQNLEVSNMVGQKIASSLAGGSVKVAIGSEPVLIRGAATSIVDTGRGSVELASTADQYSMSQGQSPGSFQYGTYAVAPSQTPDASTFTNLTPEVGTSVPTVWLDSQKAKRITGVQNIPGVNTQNQQIWAVRRWLSNVSGTVRVDYSALAKQSKDGVNIVILVDGKSVYTSPAVSGATAFIDSASFTVKSGSTVDLAVTPGTGLSAATDGTIFFAVISH